MLIIDLHSTSSQLNQLIMRSKCLENNPSIRQYYQMKKPLLDRGYRYQEEDPDYRGQPLDQNYGEGPENKRGCTDLLCLILFIVFLGALGYIAYVAFNTGNPKYLAYPFDSEGNQCKLDPGYEDYPYIFISAEVASTSSIFVCVKECPTSANSTIECAGSLGPDCTSRVEMYATKPLVTYCMPIDQAQQVVGKLVTDILNIAPLQGYFSDVYMAWPLLLGMIGISLVVSVIYSVLIRYFAGCMVWTMIFILMILLLGIGVVTALLPTSDFLKSIFHYQELPDTLKDRGFQIAVCVITFVLFGIGMLVLCCMKRQIAISIGIIKAAADFVRECCFAFFIPFYITVFQLLFVAFWVTVTLFLFSSNAGTIDPIDGTPFAMVQWNSQNQWLIIFYVFALLWIINFFSGIESFWVASTAAIWYFQEGDPQSPVLRSFCRIFYHVGSIAFGSLLIAIVTFIRIVLEYINSQVKEKTLGMSEGKAIGCFLKCTQCLVACFERVIRFLTQNAYIMIAISGKGFCQSASESFYLMIRSSAQFFISHGTTKLFINVGTALIITICTVIGYILITSVDPYRNQIQSPVFMTILFGIISLPVAWAFMQFFEKGANTILMCYCVEKDLAKNKFKCPPGLKNFLDEYVESSRLSSQA